MTFHSFETLDHLSHISILFWASTFFCLSIISLSYKLAKIKIKTKTQIIVILISFKQTKVRDNVDGIVKNYLNNSNYKWMQIRIKSMEKDWKTAILSLSRKRNLSNRSKKKVKWQHNNNKCIITILRNKYI